MKNKTLILLTCAVIFLPAVAGIFMWDILPDRLPIHFNINGQADNWCSRALAIFGLPFFALVMHLLGILTTVHDPKYENMGRKMRSIVLWICPFCSILMSVIIYSYSLKPGLFILPILEGVFGIFIMIIGNYLPKCRQNRTIGIRLPWTLHDPENWNRTHRFAAKVWITGGFIMTVNAFINSFVINVAVLILIVLLPVIYSFAYSRKHL